MHQPDERPTGNFSSCRPETGSGIVLSPLPVVAKAENAFFSFLSMLSDLKR